MFYFVKCLLLFFIDNTLYFYKEKTISSSLSKGCCLLRFKGISPATWPYSYCVILHQKIVVEDSVLNGFPADCSI